MRDLLLRGAVMKNKSNLFSIVLVSVMGLAHSFAWASPKAALSQLNDSCLDSWCDSDWSVEFAKWNSNASGVVFDGWISKPSFLENEMKFPFQCPVVGYSSDEVAYALNSKSSQNEDSELVVRDIHSQLSQCLQENFPSVEKIIQSQLSSRVIGSLQRGLAEIRGLGSLEWESKFRVESWAGDVLQVSVLQGQNRFKAVCWVDVKGLQPVQCKSL